MALGRLIEGGSLMTFGLALAAAAVGDFFRPLVDEAARLRSLPCGF